MIHIFYKKESILRGVTSALVMMFGCYGQVWADHRGGKIDDTELVIRKQRQNTVNKPNKLPCKYPIPITGLPATPFGAQDHEPVPGYETDFSSIPVLLDRSSVDHIKPKSYDSLSLSISTDPLLALSYRLYHLALLKGYWSVYVDLCPKIWKPTAYIKGTYNLNDWNITLQAGSIVDYHNKFSLPETDKYDLIQLYNKITIGKVFERHSHTMSVVYNPLVYPARYHEQLLNCQYSWAFNGKHKGYGLGVDIGYDLSNYNRTNRYLLTIMPWYGIPIKHDIKLKTSVLFSHHRPVDPSPGFAYLYPMVEMAWQRKGHIYVGVGGFGFFYKAQPVHLHTLLQKQPCLQNAIPLHNRYKGLIGYAGYQDSLSDLLSYHIKVSINQEKCLGRILKPEEGTLHDYRYTAPNLSMYHFKCNLWQRTEILKSRLAFRNKLILYAFLKNKNQPAWWYNKPSIKWQPGLELIPIKGLSIVGQGDIRRGTTIKDMRANATHLPAYIQLELQMRYQIGKKLEVYLILGNLLNRADKNYANCGREPLHITFGVQVNHLFSRHD